MVESSKLMHCFLSYLWFQKITLWSGEKFGACIWWEVQGVIMGEQSVIRTTTLEALGVTEKKDDGVFE